MESDGRIRSKDIGTGEVNSRIINNLWSENFNGSRTHPETDPGTAGWQILKSGFAVFNEVLVRGTISAARIVSAIISGGEVNITSGGKLTVGGDAETGVDPLVTLDEDGLQVGDDVVIDEDGLWVAGGLTRAVDVDRKSDAVIDATLTTTEATYGSVTFTPPSWAQAMIFWAAIRCQFAENTLQKNVTIGYRIGSGSNFDQVTQTLILGTTQSFTCFTSFEEDATGISLPSPFDLHVRASVNTGTNVLNRIGLRAHALYLR